MKWNFVYSGFETGKVNMETDIRLALNCSDDEAFFRIYRWDPYCISLGANQSIKDIDEVKAKRDNIDIARRPTGGRAILHAEELTYSVVMPLNAGLTAREIYTKISLALVKGLQDFDPGLAHAELENLQPNFPDLLKKPSGVLCFASTAKSEVKFNGKKLIGSAQRKMDKVVLQHGSILVGKFHRKLPEYLSDKSNLNILVHEMEEKTTEIETILNKSVDYDLLAEALIGGFENEWNVKFEEKPEMSFQ